MKRILAACVLLMAGAWASAQVNGQGGVYINGVLQGGGGSTYSYLWSGGISMLAPTTDAAPDTLLLKGANAWPGASTNVTGANTIITGGIGKRTFAVLDYENLVDSNVTITINGDATTLTDGDTWTAATSNGATAISLAATIDALVGVSASASGAEVRVVADAGTYTLTISSDADPGCMVATNGTNGTVQFPIGTGNLVANTAITAVGTVAYNGVIRTGVYKRTWVDTDIMNLPGKDAELKVATLPAGTVVRNAYVTVDMPETALSDLTVALGRTGALYVDYIVASDAQAEVLGDELVANGTFTGNANGWTLGLGGGTPDWYYNSNNVSRLETETAAAPLVSTEFAVVAGRHYKIVFDLTEGESAVTLSCAGFTSDPVSASATYTYYVTAATTGNTTVTITPVSIGTACSIDNVSVREGTAIVYGDASGERGANLTGYDLPSVATETDVYLNFVTTDGSKNLTDALGSTGTVYLLTETLP